MQLPGSSPFFKVEWIKHKHVNPRRYMLHARWQLFYFRLGLVRSLFDAMVCCPTLTASCWCSGRWAPPTGPVTADDTLTHHASTGCSLRPQRLDNTWWLLRRRAGLITAVTQGSSDEAAATLSKYRCEHPQYVTVNCTWFHVTVLPDGNRVHLLSTTRQTIKARSSSVWIQPLQWAAPGVICAFGADLFACSCYYCVLLPRDEWERF